MKFRVSSLELNCVAAPAWFAGGALACGPAVEVNLATDAALELELRHLALARHLAARLRRAAASG